MKQIAFAKEVFLLNSTYTWDQAITAEPDIEERLVAISRNVAMGKKDRANPSPELKVNCAYSSLYTSLVVYMTQYCQCLLMIFMR